MCMNDPKTVAHFEMYEKQRKWNVTLECIINIQTVVDVTFEYIENWWNVS